MLAVLPVFAAYKAPVLPAEARGKVLVSLDIDGTLLNKPEQDEVDLRQTVDWLKANAHQVVVMLNTGRSLDHIRVLAERLKDVPVQYLGLNNGQTLFINQQGLPTAQWLAQLQSHHRDGLWDKLLKHWTGWDVAKLQQLRLGLLKDFGFRPTMWHFNGVPDEMRVFERVGRYRGHWVAVAQEGHAGIVVRRKEGHWLAETDDAWVEKLIVGWRMGLARLGMAVEEKPPYPFKMPVRPKAGQMADFCMIWFGPKGISKATVVDHVLRLEPSVEAVITAGDEAYNDSELLSRPVYRPTDRTVANYPIIAGDCPRLRETVAAVVEENRMANAPKGKLAEALTVQLLKIASPQQP